MSRGQGGSGGGGGGKAPSAPSQSSGAAPSAGPSSPKLGRSGAQQNASPSPASKPVSRGDLNPKADSAAQSAGRDLHSKGVAQADSTAQNTGGSKPSDPTQQARGRSL
jgi:hypothetical protein